MLKVKNVKK